MHSSSIRIQPQSFSSNRPGPREPRPLHRAPAKLRRTCAAVTLACLCSLGTSQDTPADTAGTVVGIHYQDLLPADGDTIEVLLPRPGQGSFDGVMLSSSDECLELGELGDPGPEFTLILEVHLTGDGSDREAGAACSASIAASYRDGDASWDGVTLLRGNRLAYPPVPADTMEATLTLDRISLPFEPGARSSASLVNLTLTNRANQPVVVEGLADQAAFTDLVGSVYQYGGGFDGTLAGLQQVGHDPAPTTLAPGDSTSIALILDPESRLPDGSAVLTVQPALLVSIAGSLHSLRFERLSTAWGNELP